MDYIIYTLEGFTQSPTFDDVENCQIIDFIYDENNLKKAEVINKYLQSNDFCLKSGFNKCHLKVAYRINEKALSALDDVLGYLWEKEKKDYEECEDDKRASHIFKKIEILAHYLDKDFSKIKKFDK